MKERWHPPFSEMVERAMEARALTRKRDHYVRLYGRGDLTGESVEDRSGGWEDMRQMTRPEHTMCRCVVSVQHNAFQVRGRGRTR